MSKFIYDFFMGTEINTENILESQKSLGNFSADISAVLNSSYYNYDKTSNNSGEQR